VPPASKRKEKEKKKKRLTPFGINIMRSQVLYQLGCPQTVLGSEVSVQKQKQRLCILVQRSVIASNDAGVEAGNDAQSIVSRGSVKACPEFHAGVGTHAKANC